MNVSKIVFAVVFHHQNLSKTQRTPFTILENGNFFKNFLNSVNALVLAEY